MSIQICRALLDSDLSDGQLIDAIKSKGGFACQGKPLEMQGWRKLQLSKVEIGGITGTGPGLLGAARDWRRKAIAQVQL